MLAEIWRYFLRQTEPKDLHGLFREFNCDLPRHAEKGSLVRAPVKRIGRPSGHAEGEPRS